jgi:HK97 family phage prohead protease
MRRIIQPNTVKFAGNQVGARQALAIVSSEQRDGMGDVILQDGIDYSDFMRGGGTVLWQHDANYPVASTVRLSVVNGCLTALAQFPPEGTSEKSDECYRLIREGVVSSTSIGFIPVEWDFLDNNRPGSGVLFRQVQMLEFSYVSVPANPDAMIIGKSLARSSDHAGLADRIAIVAKLRRGLDAHPPSGPVDAVLLRHGS